MVLKILHLYSDPCNPYIKLKEIHLQILTLTSVSDAPHPEIVAQCLLACGW